MRTGNLVFSALQFLFGVFVLFAGALFLGVHYSSYLRSFAAEFLRHSSLFIFGLCLSGAGIFLLIVFYRMYRGVYYEIRMGISVDPKLIRKYVENYWNLAHPDLQSTIEVLMARNQIEIYMEFATPVPEIQSKLAAAETDLGALLKEQFGYAKDFQLSVTAK